MCEIILNAYLGALAFVHVFPLFFRLRGPRLLIIDYLAASLLLSGWFRACLCVLYMLPSKSTHQRTNNDDDDDDGGSVLRDIPKNTSAEDTGGEIVLDKR